jgi:hypothetical protein
MKRAYPRWFLGGSAGDWAAPRRLCVVRSQCVALTTSGACCWAYDRLMSTMQGAGLLLMICLSQSGKVQTQKGCNGGACRVLQGRRGTDFGGKPAQFKNCLSLGKDHKCLRLLQCIIQIIIQLLWPCGGLSWVAVSLHMHSMLSLVGAAAAS